VAASDAASRIEEIGEGRLVAHPSPADLENTSCVVKIGGEPDRIQDEPGATVHARHVGTSRGWVPQFS
jgi:hypothetical protein